MYDNQQILTKAIQKAIDGGFSNWPELMYDDSTGFLYRRERGDAGNLALEQVIFNHDFAKALWGEEETKKHSHFAQEVVKHGWQYHLQQMVIADDPIKYLGEHL